MNKEVTNYIKKTSEDQQKILEELRKLILSTAPKAKEQFKWSRPVYGIEKDFCYIKANKKNITLGFFEFAKIKTNKELIEGTGKSMRHVKLNGLNQIKEFKLKKMLEEVLK